MAEAPSERARVRRKPSRADYERHTIDAILDEGLLAHLGFVVDEQPYVIPTLHARVGDAVYIHGSSASRGLRTLAAGAPACLTVSLMDGLVLARSAMHHSINYRSVVVLGKATLVEDPDERLRALEAFVERLVPGRWGEVRPPTAVELKATQVLHMPLDEASAKLRTGPPGDDDEDYALPYWAGEIPLRLRAEPPQPDPLLAPGILPSDVVERWIARRS